MLTQAAALESAKYSMRVNAVAPGAIRTPLLNDRLGDARQREGLETRIPQHRLGEPGDVAAAIEFLLSDGAADITVVVLPVDVGFLLT